ncbi:MAG: peptidoglycan-binding domain-containing protein [Sterolibacterium sp.]
MARLAKALVVLRDQVNALAPKRSKASDGWIGDSKHASRKSEHNPNAAGVVRALDITHDPRNGVDNATLAEALRKSADPRIYYVISNGRIANSGKPWRKYGGTNGHYQHFHVSVVEDPKLYDSAKPWALDGSVVKADMTQPAVVERPFLVRGSKGDAVADLQRKLKIMVDGDFGPKTEKAVKALQKANGLTVDGKVGPQTWGALK